MQLPIALPSHNNLPTPHHVRKCQIMPLDRASVSTASRHQPASHPRRKAAVRLAVWITRLLSGRSVGFATCRRRRIGPVQCLTIATVPCPAIHIALPASPIHISLSLTIAKRGGSRVYAHAMIACLACLFHCATA